MRWSRSCSSSSPSTTSGRPGWLAAAAGFFGYAREWVRSDPASGAAPAQTGVAAATSGAGTPAAGTSLAAAVVTAEVAVCGVVGGVTAIEAVTGTSLVTGRSTSFFGGSDHGIGVGSAVRAEKYVVETSAGSARTVTLEHAAGRRVSVAIRRAGDFDLYAYLLEGKRRELNSTGFVSVFDSGFIEPTKLKGPGPFPRQARPHRHRHRQDHRARQIRSSMTMHGIG